MARLECGVDGVAPVAPLLVSICIGRIGVGHVDHRRGTAESLFQGVPGRQIAVHDLRLRDARSLAAANARLRVTALAENLPCLSSAPCTSDAS